MKPTEALQYLDQCLGAWIATLPAPAQGPTRQAVVQAINAVHAPVVAAEAMASKDHASNSG